MIVLKIIAVIALVVFLLLLILHYTTYNWPRGWKANIYYRKDFSDEMCAIVGQKNRGEITKEEEFKALEKAYLADKTNIDLCELVHNNALLHSHKWDIEYSAMYSHDENQTPIPIHRYWTKEFIDFSLNKIKEGARPGFIARFYDRRLRKYF